MKHLLKWKRLSLLPFLLLSLPTFSQYSPTIASGRPGNANGAATVGKNILQFQIGIQQAGYSNALGPRYSEFSENLVIRYGLTERFEVRTVINQANGTFINGGDRKINGFNTTMLRGRIKVIENLAIQVGLNMPILRNDFDDEYSSPELKVMYNTNFSDNLSLTTNLGAVWEGIDALWGDSGKDPYGFYVFSFSAGLPQNFSLILEAYGDFDINGIQNYYDAGIGYLVNNDLLLDINGGWGENSGIESYFVTLGASYRLNLN